MRRFAILSTTMLPQRKPPKLPDRYRWRSNRSATEEKSLLDADTQSGYSGCPRRCVRHGLGGALTVQLVLLVLMLLGHSRGRVNRFCSPRTLVSLPSTVRIRIDRRRAEGAMPVAGAHFHRHMRPVATLQPCQTKLKQNEIASAHPPIAPRRHVPFTFLPLGAGHWEVYQW